MGHNIGRCQKISRFLFLELEAALRYSSRRYRDTLGPRGDLWHIAVSGGGIGNVVGRDVCRTLVRPGDMNGLSTIAALAMTTLEGQRIYQRPGHPTRITTIVLLLDVCTYKGRYL